MASRTITFDPSQITDGDGSDGILEIGGLRLTLTAQGNWSFGVVNGRLTFSEDPAYGGEAFRIDVTTISGNLIKPIAIDVHYNGTPLIQGDYAATMAIYNATVPDADLAANTFVGNEYWTHLDWNAITPAAANIQIYDYKVTPESVNPTSSFWIDNLVVDTDTPPPDTTPPTVNSITRTSAEFTNDGTVTYTVVFSESVTGVDASDFLLTATGNAGGTISSVTGSGTTYTVTVGSLTGFGTLRLDLKGSGTGIKDAANNTIASGYTAGEQYSMVNDAPVLTPAMPTLTGLTDTDVSNPGQSVASILGASVSDVDFNAVEGIAVTGLASGIGTWQYSTNGGASWSGIGSVSSAAALLLRATDRVRFVPDGVNGTTGSLTYHAWDQTGATAGMQGSKVDASISGGNSPFSAATDTVNVTVTAVNDAPVVTTSGGTTAFTEGDNAASTPVTIDSGLTLSDSDNATFASATVSITGNFSSAQDVLAFVNDGLTAGNIVGSYDSATGVLTLTSAGAMATAAQWQAALRSVTYANNSDTPGTATRTISFAVNDGGATSASVTKTVSVASTNDTPVHSVPAAQTVLQDTSLVFSAGNGNLISVSDSDAGGGILEVTLTATHGLLTLSGSSGLVFLVGSGTGDATMTFVGTLSDIGLALNGLVFTPTAGYYGPASLAITTSDLGSTGSGGAQTDSDTIVIDVDSLEASVTNVNVTNPDGSYRAGDVLYVTVTFDQAVMVDTAGGSPTLLLETGSIDRPAVYLSGSGSNVLTFAYQVQDGDVSADLDYQSALALALNGATIRSIANDDAVLTLPAPGSPGSLAGQRAIVIEHVLPPSDPGPVVVPNTGGGVDITITDPSQLTSGLGTSGVDHVFFGGSGTVNMPGNVENLSLTGNGDANVLANSLHNLVLGNEGSNILQGLAGNDTIIAGAGSDTVIGGAGSDSIFGGAGSDQLQGGTGNDRVTGGDGNDRALGGSGRDVIYGNSGSDRLFGDDGDDRVSGGDGNDRVSGGSGRDIVYGDAGNDRISGDNGNDRVSGGLGNDVVDGGSGNDRVFGDAGNDTLYGGSGNDTIYGGDGNDVLSSGSGHDTFVFDTKLNARTNVDSIQDFNVAEDSIALDNAVFTQLGAGTDARPIQLQSGFFVVGSKALDADDYLIYDPTTGLLSYDADGTGARGSVAFAQLTKNLPLTSMDIFVF